MLIHTCMVHPCSLPSPAHKAKGQFDHLEKKKNLSDLKTRGGKIDHRLPYHIQQKKFLSAAAKGAACIHEYDHHCYQTINNILRKSESGSNLI